MLFLSKIPRQRFAFVLLVFPLFLLSSCLCRYEHSILKSACSGDSTPKRIILNLSETPSVSQAVTWQTKSAALKARAQIAPAGEFSEFKKNIRSIPAISKALKLKDGSIVYHHSVIFKELSPYTSYVYRVGDLDKFCEWNCFKTASSTHEPFQFLYFGDIQNQIQSLCPQIFRAAYKKAPDAAFWHFIGDLVNNGDADAEWGALFDALGWIPRVTPMILLPGNHEYPDKRFIQEKDFSLFELWRPHFTLPENGPEGLEETAYYIDYQGTRFVMLNGNEKLYEQARWLDAILSKNPQAWTIVAIHQPLYSTGRRKERPDYQKAFLPIFDKYSVDLVLQGHDHNYSRSYKLKNGKRVKDNEKGTVYIISVCGPKSYPVNDRYNALMAKTGTKKQLFQLITVNGKSLVYQSFDAKGKLFDSVTLEKGDSCLKKQ